jgi:ubiquinone/menaquinone biosynthesis C-methylase UbiE
VSSRLDWISLLSAPAQRELLPPLPPANGHLDKKDGSWLHLDLERAELERALNNDPFPLPATADREDYYGERHLDYWVSGYNDFRMLHRIYSKHTPNSSPNTVLDLGCASGRILRHFTYQHLGCRTIGVDVKHAHIDWIRRHLDARAIAFPVTILPNLQFADATFDLVYAFSVFTHIAEFDTTWISELSRITKVGGLVCVTILGDEAWGKMKPGFSVYDDIARVQPHFDQKFKFGPEFFAITPLDRFSITWRSLHPVYHGLSFQSYTYVQRNWGRIMEIVDIMRGAHVTQDLVILRKN